MPKMSTHKVDGGGVEEVTRTRQLEETILPEMLPNFFDERGTTRGKTKSSRQDTKAKQQWPFPTKVLTKMGKPLKTNSNNYEEAIF